MVLLFFFFASLYWQLAMDLVTFTVFTTDVAWGLWCYWRHAKQSNLSLACVLVKANRVLVLWHNAPFKLVVVFFKAQNHRIQWRQQQPHAEVFCTYCQVSIIPRVVLRWPVVLYFLSIPQSVIKTYRNTDVPAHTHTEVIIYNTPTSKSTY